MALTESSSLRLTLADPPPRAAAIRAEVRDFLQAERAAGSFAPRCDAWLSGFSPEFSRRLGAHGWLGMCWPRRYGGGEHSGLERFVVVEELLAAGAPVAAHWVSDRQSGPALLRYGTEEQRQLLLPSMARGECYFAIGMSEPDSGSDLASVRTSAVRRSDGWQLNGRKVWTSHAHRSHYMIALCRTAPAEHGDRHSGLTQFIVDLRAPGVVINPICLLDGAHHFNEVILDDVRVPEGMLLGRPGAGWEQVTAELAFERSGPERFLSTYPLVVELARRAKGSEDPRLLGALGRLWADLSTLRQMSLGVAAALDRGELPEVTAALVKDLGTRFENDTIEVARRAASTQPALDAADPYPRSLAQAVLHAPGFTLRGGTNEILRGIVARGLGLR